MDSDGKPACKLARLNAIGTVRPSEKVELAIRLASSVNTLKVMLGL